MLDSDRKSFPEKFCALGLVAKEKNFDWDAQWEAMRYLYGPFLSEVPVAFDTEYMTKMNELLLFKNPNMYKLDMPPDWLFVNRLQYGLLSVLIPLWAVADWRTAFRNAVEQ